MDFSNFNILLISGVYYILVILISFFSLFGVYILVRYGKSPLLGLGVALIYSFIFVEILINSHNILIGLS